MSAIIRPERIARLFQDLLERKVAVSPIQAFPLSPEGSLLTASYATNDGSVAALCICDLELVLNAGAALCMIPVYEAQQSCKAKQWDGSLVENFKEILNVCAQLFCEGSIRAKLENVFCGAAERPAKIATILAKPGRRIDIQVSINGYANGRIAILTP